MRYSHALRFVPCVKVAHDANALTNAYINIYRKKPVSYTHLTLPTTSRV